MSNKARKERVIRRKMLRVWNKSDIKVDIDKAFEEFIGYGTFMYINPKDGKANKITRKEGNDLVRKGNEEMKKLHNNIFKDIIDELW